MVREEQLRTRASAVQRCMEQLCHSAALLCLADHNICLPSSMGMLKSSPHHPLGQGRAVQEPRGSP